MATVKQQLKSEVTFGGRIDPSWSKSLGGLRSGVTALTKTSAGLTKEQTKLASKIRDGVLAGKDVSKLKESYAKVGRQIKENTRDQDHFNRSLKRAERLSRFRGKASGIAKGVGGAALGLGGGIARWGAAGLMGSIAALVASPVLLNNQTAEKTAKKDQYGTSMAHYTAWGGIGNAIGVSADSFGDMLKNYTQHVGKFKNTGKDKGIAQLGSLGLGAHSLSGMSTEEQFTKVMDAAIKTKDQQSASAAVNALFGGEASKILASMRKSYVETGETYSSTMKAQSKYNQISEEGASGAAAMNASLYNLWDAFTSGLAEASGLLGGELAPSITQIADNLSAWFKDGGIDKIKSIFRDNVIPAGIAFVKGLIMMGKVIFALAKKLSWILPNATDDKESIMDLQSAGQGEAAQAKADESGNREWLDKNMKEDPNFANKYKQNKDIAKNMWSSDEETQGSKKITDDILGSSSMENPFAGLTDGLTGTAATSDLKQINDTGAATPDLKQINDMVAATGGGQTKQEFKQDIKQEFNITQQAGESGDALSQRIADTARKNNPFMGGNVLNDLPGF